MTYVSVVTLAAYALVLALLAVMSVVDVRERRIPNVLVAALAGLWLLWRLVLGLAGQYMGLGFKAELRASRWPVAYWAPWCSAAVCW